MPEKNTVEWQDVTPTKKPPPGLNHLILTWKHGAYAFAHYRWSGAEWRLIDSVTESIPNEGLSVGVKDGKFELKEISVSYVQRR